jgi:hypothetical protein
MGTNWGNIPSGDDHGRDAIASTDGARWTVETEELTLTSRRTTRRPAGGPTPLGDGVQLRVTRNGNLIGYCLSDAA